MARHRDVGTAQLRRSRGMPCGSDVLRPRPRDHRRRPNDDMITEIGAVKVRGGECLGTFQTLVNPGRAIPPQITVLTGLTDAMVATAPRIGRVLGTLVEFIGDAVIVGHNASFDLGFLRAALERDDRRDYRPTVVDTAALARRLVRDEVPDCRLGTLADRGCGSTTGPATGRSTTRSPPPICSTCSRAGTGLGVLGLDDLVALAKLAGHPQVGKLKLTADLPRSPGVYMFCGAPRRGAVRRQGHQPAPAGAQLLRQRRPTQDRADAARDADGPASRPRRSAHRRGDREPADRAACSPATTAPAPAPTSTATSGSTSARPGRASAS